jgi:hypothetical protein
MRAAGANRFRSTRAETKNASAIHGDVTCFSIIPSESQRSGLNRRPLDYESSALPLSYAGDPLHALARTRTATPCGTTPSRWRVYQFHHQGLQFSLDLSAADARHVLRTGLTGLEPATSGVTDRHSNQAELQPLVIRSLPSLPYWCITTSASLLRRPAPDSPKGNRTPLCTVKGCRPNR